MDTTYKNLFLRRNDSVRTKAFNVLSRIDAFKRTVELRRGNLNSGSNLDYIEYQKFIDKIAGEAVNIIGDAEILAQHHEEKAGSIIADTAHVLKWIVCRDIYEAAYEMYLSTQDINYKFFANLFPEMGDIRMKQYGYTLDQFCNVDDAARDQERKYNNRSVDDLMNKIFNHFVH